jgi:two-component system OmpR family sensor kinase
MSLRTRLLVGLGIIAGLLVVSGLLILGIQRAFLVSQLDDRLYRQVANATAQVAAGDAPTGPGSGQQRQARGLADAYLGVLTGTGLETLNTPATDPGLTPTLDPEDPPPSPATVPATGGDAERMRIITSERPDGGTLVLGRSMGEVDAALGGLRSTLLVVGSVLLAVIALVFWWMQRLGIDPILRVTRVARSITAGDTSQRVEPFPAGTEAHDLGTAFNQLVDTSATTQERLRQFVADASHELRTPLVTLKGYAALYGAGGFPDEPSTADAMRRIKHEADRMGRLVDDLLLLAELDRGPILSLGPVDLGEIVEDLAGDLRVVAPDRGITVVRSGSAVVQGDRDRLTQVVAALTNNALRHTPAGTGIDLRITSTPAAVRIEVADHGPGIAVADLPKVFDRFYRADVARARASGGSGLGLAIASAIVAAHGGTVGVQSPAGEGATFWVELPVAGPPERSDAPAGG